MAKLTKADLTAKVAEQTGLSKKQAQESIDALILSIKSAVAAGDDISLVGFGSFSAQKRAARDGRNPKTGAKMKIKAAKVPKFRPGKAFKEAVNA